jgi:LemA protein
MDAPALIALIAAVALGVWAVFTYNRLVADRNQVRSAWADIDVQLQRRHDLVPKLVDAVRAYAGHERATLETVVELRRRSEALTGVAEKAEVEDELEAGLHRLIAMAEAYPDLEASENFRALQDDLVETEDHLQYARRFYNGAVRIYNTRLESFPDLAVARVFAFRPAEFFDADAAAGAAPRVALGP